MGNPSCALWLLRLIEKKEKENIEDYLTLYASPNVRRNIFNCCRLRRSKMTLRKKKKKTPLTAYICVSVIAQPLMKSVNKILISVIGIHKRRQVSSEHPT